MPQSSTNRRTVPAPEEAPSEAARSSRRSFLWATGGAAALVAVPAGAVIASDADAATTAVPAKAVANPTDPPPAQPVMAYVHDAKKGEVVIMSGLTERTVIDHSLVEKLLHPPKLPVHKKKHKKKPKKHRKHVAAKPTTTVKG